MVEIGRRCEMENVTRWMMTRRNGIILETMLLHTSESSAVGFLRMVPLETISFLDGEGRN